MWEKWETLWLGKSHIREVTVGYFLFHLLKVFSLFLGKLYYLKIYHQLRNRTECFAILTTFLGTLSGVKILIISKSCYVLCKILPALLLIVILPVWSFSCGLKTIFVFHIDYIYKELSPLPPLCGLLVVNGKIGFTWLKFADLLEFICIV